jgi:ribosomal 30S subunit maturation factor RimM
MQLRVARLTKAHGLKGGIKLELYTDDPARRFTAGAGAEEDDGGAVGSKRRVRQHPSKDACQQGGPAERTSGPGEAASGFT